MNKPSIVQNSSKVYYEELNASLLYFRSPLFFIRPINHNDLETLFKWRSSPVVSQYMWSQAPASMVEQKNWYNKYLKDPGSLHFMAVRRADETVIGYCQLFKIDSGKKTVEYGVVIGDVKNIGKGAGVKLTASFVKIVFFYLGFQTMFANVNSDNRGATSIVRDFLGSKIISGPHSHRKGSECLFSLEKRAFELFEKNLFKRNRKWEEILTIEQIEQ